jgi:hypothetical protein
MNDEGALLHPGPVGELEWESLPDKELLAELVRAQWELESLTPISSHRGGGEDWDAPFDLRVARPRAVDLAKLWASQGGSPDAALAAAPSGMRPILLNHVITAFPRDGLPPGRVWALSYEFVLHDIPRAETVAVAPSNVLLRFGGLYQKVSLGFDLGGQLIVPDAMREAIEATSTISLSGASIALATEQRYQFEVSLDTSLRKVVGAPVGVGGALWKMYRQDEPLDAPIPLLQTLLVPADTKELRCTVQCSAVRAGLLGSRWGARFWPYADQEFTVYLG